MGQYGLLQVSYLCSRRYDVSVRFSYTQKIKPSFFEIRSILMGHNALGIELEVAWATPGTFTTKNYPCHIDGSDCDGGVMEWHTYEDPSVQMGRRLRHGATK